MHEYALVDNIFQILNGKIKELDIKQITEVKLVIGEMTGAEERTLSACFEIFAKNTVAEGAQVIFDRRPLKGKCPDCDIDFKIERYRFICPQCNGHKVEVISGREFYIDSISVA